MRSAPNHANYEESKANPFPTLPDVLTLNGGKKVTNAEMWWKQRRPEIVEDFEREVLGRIPKNAPKIAWTIANVENSMVGSFPVISKQLIGHADNSSYPLINVDIQMSVVTPANAPWSCPCHDDVCVRRPATTATGGRNRQRRSARNRAAHRRWLGLCADRPRQHSGGQRSRSNQRHHRACQPRPAPQAGRLGRAASLGLGRIARPRLSGDRPSRGRQACRDRRRLPLWQSRAGDHGVRYAFRPGSGGLFRRRRRQAAPAQFGRSGGESHGHGRIPLDGRQLS